MSAPPLESPLRILIAFSDTGGGHRAAARHLQAAFERIGTPVSIELVDPYAMSGRWPFNRLQAAYPKVVGGAAWLWRTGFRLTNSRLVTATAQLMAWPVLRRTFRGLREDRSPDVIVSTHPLLTSPLRRAFRETPIAVVVTDLVSGHVSWYHRLADLIVTPTRAASAQAMAGGVPRERVRELGLPVDPSFAARPHDRPILSAPLGWSTERPTVLLIGGGDGVGPIEQLAEAIDRAGLPCDLAVVTGRNAALADRLRVRAWRGTVHVYGFVHELGAMMRAAHTVVTKAGPGTICEAFAAGCPVVLFGAIPGQETGNVDFVVNAGAGVWAPRVDQVVQTLTHWMIGEDGRGAWARASAAALAAARPQAADAIAAEVLSLATAAPPAARAPSSRAR
ncbi:MAG: hypothetical protein K2R93_13045 [Gemmatimonadaceae bacterium]|nr:hypothetical protein [Gemmatimonadaceae bacterium]